MQVVDIAIGSVQIASALFSVVWEQIKQLIKNLIESHWTSLLCFFSFLLNFSSLNKRGRMCFLSRHLHVAQWSKSFTKWKLSKIIRPVITWKHLKLDKSGLVQFMNEFVNRLTTINLLNGWTVDESNGSHFGFFFFL